MGVAEWFTDFCGNLQVSNGGVISARYKAITQRLNNDFRGITSDTAYSLYVGSYGRNTAIDGFSDLDMIFQLPYETYLQYNGHQYNGQSSLLQAVKTSILKTYSSTSLKADGQVILVSFADGVVFEVVPAFENTDKSFTYPDTNEGGRWQTTDPRPEIEAIRIRNGECNGNLVRLCRMMRAWKASWDVPIGGLLIDTLAYQFIEAYRYRDKSYLYYDLMCRDFFDWAATQDTSQEFWRSPGSGQYVYRKGLFQYKARCCCNIAKEAITYESNQQEWSAKNKWRSIFGTAFPD